jgi:hypothetical protein
VHQPGYKDPGERAAAKGNLIRYIITVLGTERSLTDEEIESLQKEFERGRKVLAEKLGWKEPKRFVPEAVLGAIRRQLQGKS